MPHPLRRAPFRGICRNAMPMRTRKFIGTLLIVAILVVYSLLAMVAGAHMAMEWPEAGRVAFYALAGILWLPPVMLLIRWMARPV